MVEFPREGNKMLIISTNKNGETNLEILKSKVTSTRKSKLKFKVQEVGYYKVKMQK